MPSTMKEHIFKHIFESSEALDSGNFPYFSSCLPSDSTWRALPEFEGKIGYLDIETTGLSWQASKLTVVGIYDGKKTHSYVNGKNSLGVKSLDEFAEDIKKYSMLVTFNGQMFDMPFLKSYFKGVKFDQVHVDLRFVLRSLGITGGLKRIEQQFKLERPSDLQGLTGWDAVKLWNRYEWKGDKAALDTLIRYNAEDIVHLETLAKWAYEKKKEKALSVLSEPDEAQERLQEGQGAKSEMLKAMHYEINAV